MATYTIQPVIHILTGMLRSNQVDQEKVDEVMEHLERLKESIDEDDEEAIDLLDELQDFLQYITTVEEPFDTEEFRDELTDIIEDLRQWSK
jgi:septal ring factor EnvC (AmiA/AmiB activator)